MVKRLEEHASVRATIRRKLVQEAYIRGYVPVMLYAEMSNYVTLQRAVTLSGDITVNVGEPVMVEVKRVTGRGTMYNVVRRRLLNEAVLSAQVDSSDENSR